MSISFVHSELRGPMKALSGLCQASFTSKRQRLAQPITLLARSLFRVTEVQALAQPNRSTRAADSTAASIQEPIRYPTPFVTALG